MFGNLGLRQPVASQPADLGQVLANIVASSGGQASAPPAPQYGDTVPSGPLAQALVAATAGGVPVDRVNTGQIREGGSGRGAMLMAPLTAQPAPATTGAAKPKFFGEGGAGRFALGILGDALAGAAGGTPMFAQSMMRKQQEESARLTREAEWSRQDRNRAQDRAWAVEDRDFNANKPETFTSGRDRVRYDPRTGQTDTIYDGQEDFEIYADAMGLEPGTPDYQAALQDYVLRGNGPTAFKYDQGLEAVRNANRVALRATPTYAQANPRPRSGGGGGRPRAPSISSTVAPIIAKVAAGKPLTPGEQQAWGMYKSGRNGGGGSGGGRGAGGGGAARPITKAEYDRLPSGAEYTAPNGQRMRKK